MALLKMLGRIKTEQKNIFEISIQIKLQYACTLGPNCTHNHHTGQGERERESERERQTDRQRD